VQDRERYDCDIGMSNSHEDSSARSWRREHAAAWVLRCDRGLTAEEQDAYLAWLGADAQNGAEIARLRQHWERMDTLAAWLPEHSAQPNPDLLAPPLHRRLRRAGLLFAPLAAAAVLALAIFLRQPESAILEPVVPRDRAVATNTAHQRVLEDGSVIELNRGAEVTVEYSLVERRVVLRSGEAHFSVMRDQARPFVVRAKGVDLVAVGTGFNVRIEATAVEVLVTEGRVQVNTSAGSAVPRTIAGLADRTAASSQSGSVADQSAPDAPILVARQRAVVSLAASDPTPQIATLTPGEIERVLAWQHRLLDFTAAPLTDIVAEFNRRNVVQLVVIDPELAAVRISATFRSDNIDGFVRLLEAGFGARAERRGETEILLRQSQSGRR
jgi:transmembrane sensor